MARAIPESGLEVSIGACGGLNLPEKGERMNLAKLVTGMFFALNTTKIVAGVLFVIILFILVQRRKKRPSR